jgi:hypothetical protein
MRVQVVLLPDVCLQDSGVVRQPVKDTGRCQTKSFELPAEVWAHHAVSPKTELGDRVIDNAILQRSVPQILCHFRLLAAVWIECYSFWNFMPSVAF